RPPNAVPVRGRVAPIVESLPSSLVLPRRSDSGPIFSADCICRSSEGKPLQLIAHEVPPEFSVVISQDEHDSSNRKVRIELKPASEKKTEPGKRSAVRL